MPETVCKISKMDSPLHKAAVLKSCCTGLPRDLNELQNLDRNIICVDCAEKDRLMSLDLNMNETEIKGTSEIQEFYSGKNVFITGATGFLGKVLIEKLLRCCPGVEIMYLLVRQKKGKDIYTRTDEIFDDPMFERLKTVVPKFRHKIVPIPGDCEAAGLGLTLSDRQLLAEKVNIIFHSAATVKFDEPLRAAIVTNVCAPLHMLRLARDMKALDVFMHVSTAYSNSHLSRVEEKFYPIEACCDELLRLISKMTDEEIEEILPRILSPWPNTYTFTKALAEKELRISAGAIPLGIFRPAIVTSTASEPTENWIDNMYGPTGVAVGGATGMLRTINCDPAVTAEIVPVDLVVNCLVASARRVHLAHRQSPVPSEPMIFNYVSSVENRITWDDFVAHNMATVDENPVSNAVWYISVTLNKSAFMNAIYMIFLHLIPAALIDCLAICVGQKPKMLKVYRKIHKLTSVLCYFCTKEISFCNRRTRQLWDQTSDADKKLFPFSMAELSWKKYFVGYLKGIRKYIFKESDDSIPQAKIKWRRLYYLHQTTRVLFLILALYLFIKVLSLCFL